MKIDDVGTKIKPTSPQSVAGGENRNSHVDLFGWAQCSILN